MNRYLLVRNLDLRLIQRKLRILKEPPAQLPVPGILTKTPHAKHHLAAAQRTDENQHRLGSLTVSLQTHFAELQYV